MTGPDDSFEDEPMLPEPELLEAWEVPTMSPELSDRIMARLDGLPQQIGASRAQPDASWRSGGMGWAVVAVGMVAAAALVLTLARPGGTEPPGESPSPAAVAEPSQSTVSPAATLVLRTDPPDARVTVDGIPVPGPSPFSVVGLRPGAHRLEITRDGFLPVERTVEGGMSTELPVELPRRDVVLVLSVDPPDATVRLWAGDEAIELGSDGDRHSLQREAGVRYEVEAVADGHLARRIPLPLTGEADQEVRIQLVPEPGAEASKTPTPASSSGTSRRKRGSSPDLEDPFASRSTSDSETTIDDILSGSDGPAKSARPRTGTSTGSTSSSGTTVDDILSAGDEPAKSARLRIGTSAGQSPAKVSVDGRYIGMTPLMNVKLTPGRHRVKFRFPDGSVEVVTVKLEAGETRVVKSGR